MIVNIDKLEIIIRSGFDRFDLFRNKSFFSKSIQLIILFKEFEYLNLYESIKTYLRLLFKDVIFDLNFLVYLYG